MHSVTSQFRKNMTYIPVVSKFGPYQIGSIDFSEFIKLLLRTLHANILTPEKEKGLLRECRTYPD
jgi:hypothetical protein